MLSVVPRPAVEPEQEAVEVARIVDARLRRRVLVLGGLPPEGRDLDLVVRRSERETVAAILAEHGFLRRGKHLAPRRRWIEQWARFHGSSAFSVDLNPAERWDLPAAELEALFAEARPIEGFSYVVRPAPHHVLLLAARRLARHGGSIDPKRQRRVLRAVAEDSDAWRQARAVAPMWGLTRAMGLLETSYETGAPTRARVRALALVELGRRPSGLWWADVVGRRARSRLPQRTQVVSVSGLDGAGKSSQASALRDTLDELGVAVAREWMPLGHARRHRAIRTLRNSAEAALRLVGRFSVGSTQIDGPATVARDETDSPRGTISPAKRLREKSMIVTHSWATVVAVHQGLQHRIAVLRHFRSGKIVIFDRYTLDAASQLRFFYGSKHRFRFQKWLICRISPKPRRSYLLAVPPEVVLRRKDDMQYTLDELDEQAALLSEEAVRLAIPQLDGTRPAEELSEEIARGVWSVAG